MACKINPSLSLLKGSQLLWDNKTKPLNLFLFWVFSLDKTRGTMQVVLCTCRAQKGHTER
jgi:hypothetical protein